MTLFLKILNAISLMFSLKDDFETIHNDIEKVFKKAKRIEAKEDLKIVQAVKQVDRLQNTVDKAYENMLEVKEVSGVKAMKAKAATKAVEAAKEALQL